jgi:peroxiredoxin
VTDPLNTQLTALTVDLGVPQDVSDLITKALTSDGVTTVGLRVGEEAPDFDLPDATGKQVRLHDLLDHGPVVLSFQRGEWCPYCNLELHTWQGLLGEVTAAGAQLVAVSPQRPTNALSLSEKHELAFPVLSDVDQTAICGYRLRYELPAALKDVYANAFGVDLSVENADGNWTLTVPATFVVDQQRRIRFAYANTDWRVRAEPADVLAALRDAADSR